MAIYLNENLLIIAKTYPNPSKSYRETVCVAAVNELKEIRRLYPIEFRYLNYPQQFKKWQWIQAKVSQSSDWRPESRIIDNDSIVTGAMVGTENRWANRLNWIKNYIYPDFNTLDQARAESRISLGVIKPNDIQLEIKPAKDKDWTPDQLVSLRKDGLFDNNSVRTKPIIKKLPFDFRYTFTTGTDPTRYRFMITDWEVGAAFLKFQAKYGIDWEEKLRIKFETELKNKDLHFIMGTMRGVPNQWLIVGLVYPPRIDQPPLMNNPISDQ
ncbi:MAG TPA: hypothetical protein PK883_00760 [Anaerolineaceae bacterium]|nr:hypothetical protein [Anaerolineaceae bacterium]